MVGDSSIGMEVKMMMELFLKGTNLSCHNTSLQKGHNKAKYFETSDKILRVVVFLIHKK